MNLVTQIIQLLPCQTHNGSYFSYKLFDCFIKYVALDKIHMQQLKFMWNRISLTNLLDHICFVHVCSIYYTLLW